MLDYRTPAPANSVSIGPPICRSFFPILLLRRLNSAGNLPGIDLPSAPIPKPRRISNFPSQRGSLLIVEENPEPVNFGEKKSMSIVYDHTLSERP